MFLGTFLHTLDNKNRLMIPSKFRNSLNNKVVINKGFDGCIELRSEESFNAFASNLMNYSSNKSNSRIIVRQLLANASDVEFDNSGRILIPATLIKEANLSQEVTVIGLGNKIEIWDSLTYEKFKKETDSKFEEIAEMIDGDIDAN